LSAETNELYDYDAWRQKNIFSGERLTDQKNHIFHEPVTISLVVPVYNPKIHHLNEMINSVIGQTYPHWELCLADGNSKDNKIREIIKDFAKNDGRIKYVFLKENKGISNNTNEAVKISTGDYIGFVDHDDILTPDALYETALSIAENPDAGLFYTDSDFLSDKSHTFLSPSFKPDWSPFLFMQTNYIVHFVIIKKEVFTGLGALDPRYDGYQDTDLIFKVSEASEKIIHIPKLLYTWRSHDEQFRESVNDILEVNETALSRKKEYLYKMGAAEEHIEYFMGYRIKCSEEAVVSFIIPFFGAPEKLRNCLNSIIKIIKNDMYYAIEIMIADLAGNINKDMIYRYQNDYPFIKIIEEPGRHENNLAKILNRAVKNTSGNHIAFVNSNVVFSYTNCLLNLLTAGVFPGTAALSCKVNYKDSYNRTVSVGGREYIGSNIPIDDFYYNKTVAQNNNITTLSIDSPKDYTNVGALNDAFILIKKEIFEEANGFDEKYPRAFYIVDLCLRLRELGYYHILNNTTSVNYWRFDHPLYGEAINGFGSELAEFKSQYGDVLSKPDPYLNPNIILY